jgi:hypothetical protein
VLKKYGIDLDGVLAEFTTMMVKILNTLGANLPNNFAPTDWNWTNANLPAGLMSKAWKMVDSIDDFWMTLTPTNDIVAMAMFFHEHADKDCDIYFITAREDRHRGSVRYESERWLIDNLGQPKQTVNVIPVRSGMDKASVIHALNITCSIDDYTPTIVNAKSSLKNHHRPYLLSRPWNQDGKSYNIQIVNSLQEFFDKEPVNLK